MLNLLLNKLTVYAADYSVAPVDVGFKIPGFGDVLTFLIRTFFVEVGIKGK